MTILLTDLFKHLILAEVQRLLPYELLYIFFIQTCLFKIKDEWTRASGLLIDLMKACQIWVIQCFLNYKTI